MEEVNGKMTVQARALLEALLPGHHVEARGEPLPHWVALCLEPPVGGDERGWHGTVLGAGGIVLYGERIA